MSHGCNFIDAKSHSRDKAPGVRYKSHTAHWANEIGQLWHFFCVAMIHFVAVVYQVSFCRSGLRARLVHQIHHADDLVLLTEFVSIEGDCCDAEQY
jgi:hypothetical protein